ncbi:MAG: EAL domain-containing protein [Actinobacteria bacterium]|nr:EAL domain-containing protein [Actinomycetota bacterium]
MPTNGEVRASWAFLALGLGVISLYPAMSDLDLGYDVWFGLFSIAASIAVLAFGARRAVDRWPWILIGLGLAAFATGDAVYVVYNAAGVEMPSPSVADGLYLTGYPLLGAGLLRIIRKRSPGRDWPALIDAAIITTAASGAVWAFMLGPIVGDRELTELEKAVALAQPMASVALLAFATRLVILSTSGNGALRLLVVALGLQLVGDIGYGVGTLQGWYGGEGPIDLAWLVSYVLWGMCALHPAVRTLTDEVDAPDEGLGGRRIALLVLAILGAPAMMAYGSVRAGSTELLVTAGTSVAVFLLVVVRLGGLIRRQERARQRERSLRNSAASFVSARTRDDVIRVTRDTAYALVDDEPGIRIALTALDDALADRVADAWVLGPAKMTEEILGRLPAHAVADHVSRATTLIAPVLERGRAELVLVARSERPLSSGVAHALETLVSQASLALDAAHHAESLLERRSQERFRSLVQRSRDVISILEEDGTIRFVAPSVLDVLGYRPEDVVGQRLQSLLAEEDLTAYASLMDAVESGGGRSEREWMIRHRDGNWRTFDAVLTDMRDDPSVAGFVVTAHDVTERKALERQLTHQAFHDSLTGLPNRALFADRVTHALTRRAEGATIGVLFVDVDDFKTVNDSLGHAAGDALLVEVARRLRGALRPSDTPARLGGDEFGILVEDVQSPETLVTVARRLLETLKEPFVVGSATAQPRASVGIALGQAGQSAGEVLRNADLAMYRAKGAGGFRYALFEDAMHRAATQRLQLKADLTRAIESGSLDLVFQPIVELESASAIGAEALLRWTHPEAGPIEPAVFVPLAEETGLILELGRWVFEQAALQASTWAPLASGAQPFVSVNISARQLQDPAFVPFVAGIVSRPGLSAERLVLEITESTLLTDQETVVGRLRALRDLGARVWIDDFGTGFSSLSYLQHLPVGALKIPKPFVDALVVGDGSQLADAVVQVAESLRLETIAEGIETPSQRTALLGIGCGLGQGFLFAEPLPARDLGAFGLGAGDPPNRRAAA